MADEEYTIEEVAFQAHHKVDTVIEVLIEKGIISEEDLKKKSEELAAEYEESDEE